MPIGINRYPGGPRSWRKKPTLESSSPPPIRRPIVNLHEASTHQCGPLSLGELVRDPERLHALLVGQQVHGSGPVSAPQAAVKAERLEDLPQRLPNVWIRKGLMG